MQDDYHIPVLLQQSVDGMNIRESGIYVDLTFGGGGHSKEILKRLKSGKLIAFDQDSDTRQNVNKLMEKVDYKSKFIFFQANFKYISNYLKYAGYTEVDGILADLGVSSYQLDERERGFSFRLGGIPDMRMNKEANVSALNILNEYKEEDLSVVFKLYGEIKNAAKLSSAICKERERSKIERIDQLNKIIQSTFKTSKEFKISAKIYQALRIETNKEIDALKSMLMQAHGLLKPGGRMVVISYHSLEDRLVKNFFKTGNFQGEIKTDIYGKRELLFKDVAKGVIVPDQKEIERNNRARSAKLRIAEKK
jgi:16S rRNA (cytosine1402-N4)-methyltransferase